MFIQSSGLPLSCRSTPSSQPQSPLPALESSQKFKTVSKLNVGNVKASFCGPGWEMVLIVSKKILHWPSLVCKAAQSQKEAGKCGWFDGKQVSLCHMKSKLETFPLNCHKEGLGILLSFEKCLLY